MLHYYVNIHETMDQFSPVSFAPNDINLARVFLEVLGQILLD